MDYSVNHIFFVCAQHAALVFHADIGHFVARKVYELGGVFSEKGVFAGFSVRPYNIVAFVDFLY